MAAAVKLSQQPRTESCVVPGIPKPGKREKRPLGVPCVSDRALQRSTAQVLAAIYEQDFLPCSFGGALHR